MKSLLLAALAAPMLFLSSCDNNNASSSIDESSYIDITKDNAIIYFRVSYEYEEEKSLEIGEKNIYVMLYASPRDGYEVVKDCSLIYSIKVQRNNAGFISSNELLIKKGETSVSVEHVAYTYTNTLPSDTVSVALTLSRASGKVVAK